MSSGESVAAAVVVASASAVAKVGQRSFFGQLDVTVIITVAKLFVIGGAGFISAKRPKGNEVNTLMLYNYSSHTSLTTLHPNIVRSSSNRLFRTAQ